MEIAVATMMEWHRAMFPLIVIASQWFQWCDVSMGFHAMFPHVSNSRTNIQFQRQTAAFLSGLQKAQSLLEGVPWSEMGPEKFDSLIVPYLSRKSLEGGSTWHSLLVEIYESSLEESKECRAYVIRQTSRCPATIQTCTIFYRGWVNTSASMNSAQLFCKRFPYIFEQQQRQQ